MLLLEPYGSFVFDLFSPSNPLLVFQIFQEIPQLHDSGIVIGRRLALLYPWHLQRL